MNRVRNYLDDGGRPICTVCGATIDDRKAVARIGDCMIHVECWVTAHAIEEPCEATP